ncbi:MAG TPA: hypothetical protein PKE39_07325 [Ignavibacteria bacterium]|nr:hypothetical protein [Ignavibacteria bacterium]HMQ98820.1 hypothetical protein [Ignavibacteria bacterium]
MEGILLGYDIDEKPLILNKFNVQTKANSFRLIRVTNPYDRIDPNWKRLPTNGKIIKPHSTIISAFKKKVYERIPPGPSYIELISEIYYRGFEVYLVGGTVRDVLQENTSQDIDIVTAMPLKSFIPLLKSMFNENVHYYNKTGFVRIGGAPASGDPFIDIKNFPLYNPGGQTALFGSDINIDLKFRDFSCNAIYYDPINEVLIDPAGSGIDDAMDKKLILVKDVDIQGPLHHTATVVIRLIKFVGRGYNCPKETMLEIRDKFCPLLSTMSAAERIRYMNAQIFNKNREGKRVEIYEAFAETMSELGLEEEYHKYFKPIEELLDLG